tara:strand:- start:51 stop:728 length:678 start_codon:yes stop_codon:yes gene_type:complete
MDKESEKGQEKNKETPNNEKELYEKHAEKKQRSIFLITITIIITALIILFSARFILNEEKYPEYTYNGFTFTKIAGLWHTEWQSGNDLYKIHLRYGPKESEDVPVYVNENTNINPSADTYITFDPGENKAYVALASTELALSLSRAFGTKPIAACSNNESYACFTRPIVTCESTKYNNISVIYIKEDDENKVTMDGNCLIIQGRGEDIVKAADKVIWIWYGIIKD